MALRYAKKIFRRDVIRGVRARWLAQYNYLKDDHKVGWCDKTAGQIRQEFKALDLESCTPQDIDRVIGTPDWAKNECDDCQGDFDVVLHLGEEPDYEARWWSLCRGCLSKAADELTPA